MVEWRKYGAFRVEAETLCITANTWIRFNGFNQTVTVQLEGEMTEGKRKGKLDQKDVGEEQRERQREVERQAERERTAGTGW